MDREHARKGGQPWKAIPIAMFSLLLAGGCGTSSQSGAKSKEAGPAQDASLRQASSATRGSSDDPHEMKVIRSGITPEMRALCSADLNMEHERVVLTSKLARAPLEITKPSMVVVFEKGITAAISIPAGARVAAVCVVNIAPHGRVELVVEGRVERVSLRSAGERAETSLRVEAEGEVSEGRVAIGHDDASIRIEGAGAFDCAAFKDADGLPERAFACSRAR